MSIEVRRVSEGLVAVGALVGSGGAVGGLVLLEVRLLAELLLADGALERSFSYDTSL